MTTVVKALLGGAVVAVPASSVTMYVFRESIFNGGLPKETTELTSRCYVIPTEQSSTPAKLLICKGQEALTSGENSEYFLYNKDGNKQHIKVTEIKKKESNLEVTLEGNETQETVTLQMKLEEWSGVTTALNLKDTCSLVVNSEEHGGTKWQCNFVSPSDPKEIKLTHFRG